MENIKFNLLNKYNGMILYIKYYIVKLNIFPVSSAIHHFKLEKYVMLV
jgi:hypothetical protein